MDVKQKSPSKWNIINNFKTNKQPIVQDASYWIGLTFMVTIFVLIRHGYIG